MWSNLLNWRFFMALIAMAIVAVSIYFTNNMAKKIALQEKNSVEIFALAQENIADINNVDNKLAFSIIQSNSNIPVLITDSLDKIIDSRNITPNTHIILKKKLKSFKAQHPVIKSGPQHIYYGESQLLEQLKYFPYIMLAIITLFIGILYIAYTTANASLQNKVWVGMSKETAHQLGTPIMSLVGWLEYLKLQGKEDIANEMQNDVDRLQLIANRFGKIGNKPELTKHNIVESLNNISAYMSKRSPQKVNINCNYNKNAKIECLLNAPLFEWVLENLIRNSLDAMQGKGEINIQIQQKEKSINIDLADTGKGMTSNLRNKIFKPGFSTKERGWGLGLSLAKRIIDQYHNGNIYVLNSEIGKGTTFRITLPSA